MSVLDRVFVLESENVALRKQLNAISDKYVELEKVIEGKKYRVASLQEELHTKKKEIATLSTTVQYWFIHCNKVFSQFNRAYGILMEKHRILDNKHQRLCAAVGESLDHVRKARSPNYMSKKTFNNLENAYNENK